MKESRKRPLTHTLLCAESIRKKFVEAEAEKFIDEVTRSKLLRRAEEKFSMLDEAGVIFH